MNEHRETKNNRLPLKSPYDIQPSDKIIEALNTDINTIKNYIKVLIEEILHIISQTEDLGTDKRDIEAVIAEYENNSGINEILDSEEFNYVLYSIDRIETYLGKYTSEKIRYQIIDQINFFKENPVMFIYVFLQLINRSDKELHNMLEVTNFWDILNIQENPMDINDYIQKDCNGSLVLVNSIYENLKC